MTSVASVTSNNVHAGPLADLMEEVTRSAYHPLSLRETPTDGSPRCAAQHFTKA